LYGGYLKDSKFQNSENEAHQIGPENYGNQNFRFLAFIKAATAVTARDRRKKFTTQIMLFIHKSPKEVNPSKV
jgi:hypothetical protein